MVDLPTNISRNRWHFFILIVMCCCFLIVPSMADLYAGPPIPICTAPDVQIYPSITVAGGMLRIAWEDNRNGNYDIYMFEHSLVRGSSGSSKEKIVYMGPGDQKDVSIFGNFVVWEDNRTGNWDIYAKNLKTGKIFAVCSSPSDQTDPEIFGTYVVWQDNRNGNWDIYLKNLNPKGKFAKETPVSTGPGNQMRPDIWCNPASGIKLKELYIVWDDTRNGPFADIYWKNLKTGEEHQISNQANSNEFSPKVSANHVMWNDWRNGNWDIYSRTVSASGMSPTEDAVIVRPANQLMCDFYIDTAVYFDTAKGDGNLDVYAWDAHEGDIPVNVGPGTQAGPAIFYDIVAYYSAPDGSQLDIYMTELVHGLSPLPPTNKVTPKFSFTPSMVTKGQLLGLVDKTDLGAVRNWYFYKWDFNGDGITDSNLLAPIVAFDTPGVKQLSLAIGLGPTGEEPTVISKTVTKTVTVT